MGIMTDFARPDGVAAKGYLAMAGHGRPGIIVIQEWWGLNDQICGVADRFARAGYNALAPDLYQGKVTTTPDEASHLMTGLDFPDATHENLRGAALELKKQSDKVAVMGFCMGGALDHRRRGACPRHRCGGVLLRHPPKEFADPAKIRVPFRAISPIRTIGARRPRSMISKRP